MSYRFPRKLSCRIYCGPSQINFYRSSKIFLWENSFQLLLSMSIFSHVHISLLWISILTLSLIKMMIIIRMSVRCRCCLFFFLLDCDEDVLHLIWFLDAFSWIVLLGSPVDCLWFWIFSILSSCNFFQFLNPWSNYVVLDYNYLDTSLFLLLQYFSFEVFTGVFLLTTIFFCNQGFVMIS